MSQGHPAFRESGVTGHLVDKRRSRADLVGGRGGPEGSLDSRNRGVDRRRADLVESWGSWVLRGNWIPGIVGSIGVELTLWSPGGRGIPRIVRSIRGVELTSWGPGGRGVSRVSVVGVGCGDEVGAVPGPALAQSAEDGEHLLHRLGLVVLGLALQEVLVRRL